MTVDLATVVAIRFRLMPGLVPRHRERLDRLRRWLGDPWLEYMVDDMASGTRPCWRGMAMLKRASGRPG